MNRGGNRAGAGRPPSRPREEHFRRLDVRVLAREGMLQQGRWECQWVEPGSGKTLATLRMDVHDGELVLHYAMGTSSTSCVVPVRETACHLGGSRDWLVCPCCERRVAILRLDRWRIACGKCMGVSYRSQRVDLCRRMWLKQRKLEARLGPHWAQPAHMSMQAYARIISAIRSCQVRREAWLAAALVGVRDDLNVLRDGMQGAPR